MIASAALQPPTKNGTPSFRPICLLHPNIVPDGKRPKWTVLTRRVGLSVHEAIDVDTYEFNGR
jgi:hypothetical protein